MPMPRHQAIVDAHLQTIRDLRNQVDRLQQPMREEIHALKTANGQLTRRLAELERRDACARDLIQALVAYMALASGKPSDAGPLV